MNHLRVHQGPGTWMDGEARVEHLVNTFNLSILALDRLVVTPQAVYFSTTGELLGVRLNGVMKREETEKGLDEVA